MRVLALPSENQACTKIRTLWPAEAAGVDLTVVPFSTFMAKDEGAGLLRPTPEIAAYDVAILQRPHFEGCVELISMIQSFGVAVVVELDDRLWETVELSRWPRTATSTGVILACCHAADLVTCSTVALAAEVPNENAVTIPNSVPASYLTIPRPEPREVKVVGWSGTMRGHVGALEQTGRAIHQVTRDGSVVFHSIGDPTIGKRLHLPESAFTFENATGRHEDVLNSWVGSVTMERYPYAVAHLDVGLAPVAPRYGAYKSYLKGLEYAALGIPFVASPTTEYRRLVGMGLGHLAAEKHDWARKIRRRLYAPETAEELRFTAAKMTHEATGWRWLEAWEEAMRIRRQHSRNGLDKVTR